MKKIFYAVIAGTMLASGAALMTGSNALADAPFPPDCRLAGINQGIDGAIAEIKQSPALGHAGGHYAKAIKDLEAVKKQLHEGCHAWNKDHEKGKK
jgi:hypothetical protein